MTRHRRHLQLLLLPVVGVLATSTTLPVVSAAPPVDAPIEQTAASETWFVDDDDRELNGLDRAARLDVTIPPGWTISGPARLDVSYVLGANASGLMSVSVNGAYIDDFLLGRAAQSHAVEIPADAFDTGENVVELTAAIDLVVDRECRDPSHPARRLDLNSETKLTLPLAPTGPTDLSDFPAVMEPIGMTDRIVDIHVLGPASGDTMSATADVVTAIREATDREIGLDVQVHEPSAFTGDLIDPQRPSVVVGLTADAKAAPALTDRTDAGAISLHRGEGGRPILVVTGTDGTDLQDATERLVGIDPIDGSTRTDRFTLLDLAYESREITGPGRDSTVYGFDIPIGGVPTGASISVIARRSTGAAGLDGVGVILNGRRIAVARFDSSGRTEDDPLDIPGDVLRPGRNLLRLDADFAHEPEGCLTGDRDQSVEIEPATTVELDNAGGLVELDLDDLPFTFRQPDDSEALTIVLPVSPTSGEIADAVDLAGLLGGEGRPGRIEIGDALDDSTYESHHLVVLGEAARQPVLARLNMAAAVDDGTASLSEASIGFVVRDDIPGRLVLVISGSDDVQSRAAAAALRAVETRAMMTGGAVVVLLDDEAPVIRQTTRPFFVELDLTDGNEGELDAADATTGEEAAADPDGESSVSTTAPSVVADSTSTPIEGTSDDSILSGYGFEVVVTLILGAAVLMTFGVVYIVKRRRTTSD